MLQFHSSQRPLGDPDDWVPGRGTHSYLLSCPPSTGVPRGSRARRNPCQTFDPGWGRVRRDDSHSKRLTRSLNP